METGYCKYITESEMQRFMQKLDSLQSPPMKCAIRMMQILGLRVGEVVRIKLSDFSDDFGRVNVVLEKSHGRIRQRQIPSILQKYLKRYHRYNQRKYRDGYIFYPYANQSPYSHIQEGAVRAKVRIICRAIGLNDFYHVRRGNGDKKLYRISPHTFRHYFLTKIWQTTKDIKVCQEIIGHKRTETTFDYIKMLHTVISEKDVLERAFG